MSGRFAQTVPNQEEIKSPDGELSRVESPPVTERSGFVGMAAEDKEDTRKLLN